MGLMTDKSSPSDFSREDIELCWEWYKAAVPYSEEEIAQIHADSPKWLDERMQSATARDVLKLLGLIN